MYDTQGHSWRAGGDIRPSRIVKISTAADFTALEADANEFGIGISQVGTEDPPGLSGASTNAASAGKNVQVFGPGSICLLELGSGGATRAGFLKSDADGKGVAIATTGTTAQNVVAVALESGAENEKVRVQVLPMHKVYPALS